ncbi:diguanylate cyclase [Methylotuvimicrobium buryatense]|uniref:Diguanylate cyclase n=1 Tax=Methylotuvimicrobium buryatense TaxID=95641 RepID=A0A4P9ULQ1_METBY|nr:diguanylate cyclase [Methylotuvimicrobium buryatense]
MQLLTIGCLVFSSLSVWATELDSVTLQLKWQHQFQFAGYYAAKEKGFYKDVGLDVTIIEATPDIDVVQEVIKGRAQFGVGTSELVLNRHRGEKVLVLGVVLQHSPLSLVTLKESGIDNIHKLLDRKVMIEANSSELFAYLQQEGFTKKAFKLEPHNFDLSDLLAGKIDAMSIYETDEPYLLKQQKRAFNQFSPRMSGIDFYGDNFFTTDTELEKHPQRVEAFREATMRGWHYAMQHPDEIVQLIYKNYSQRHSIEHLRFEAAMMHDLMQPELIEVGYMNMGRWQHIAETYHKLGLLPENFDVEPMLHFPLSADYLKNLKIKLYYMAAGLTLLILLWIILFRFYRTARINETKLNTVFNNTPLSMIVLDANNRVLRWNTEAEKTFLWQAKDIIKKNVLLITPPEKHAEVEAVLAAVRKNHRIMHHENINIRKDGSEVLCQWMNAPFKHNQNQSDFIICMAQDITEQNRLKEALEHAAHYDKLTSLPNRALILEKLKQSIETAARHKAKTAVLFLDLNGFKAINDTLGHEAGDIVLVAVAQRLPQAIRESDYAGRLGGDEFLIILQDIGSLENAQNIANNVRALVCQPCVINTETISVGVSIGISLYPDDATNINALIHQADQDMYQAKHTRDLTKNKIPNNDIMHAFSFAGEQNLPTDSGNGG